MGKTVDITDKLTFDENPSFKIKGQNIEVNSDAPTVLKIMRLMQEDDFENHIIEAYELLFTEKERKKLEKLKLSFNDFNVVIQTAMSLAAGTYDEEDTEQGEAEIHTTTL